MSRLDQLPHGHCSLSCLWSWRERAEQLIQACVALGQPALRPSGEVQVARLEGREGRPSRDQGRVAVLFEGDLIERLGSGCGCVDERRLEPAGPLELPVLPVEHVEAAVRSTVDEAV